MVNQGVNLGLPGAPAQPRTLYSGSQRGQGGGGGLWAGPRDPAVLEGGVAGGSVGLLSMGVAVLTAGGMCCVHHSTVWMRAVSWSGESQRAGLLPPRG